MTSGTRQTSLASRADRNDPDSTSPSRRPGGRPARARPGPRLGAPFRVRRRRPRRSAGAMARGSAASRRRPRQTGPAAAAARRPCHARRGRPPRHPRGSAAPGRHSRTHRGNRRRCRIASCRPYAADGAALGSWSTRAPRTARSETRRTTPPRGTSRHRSRAPCNNRPGTSCRRCAAPARSSRSHSCTNPRSRADTQRARRPMRAVGAAGTNETWRARWSVRGSKPGRRGMHS